MEDGQFDPTALGAKCGVCPLKGRTPVPAAKPLSGKKALFVIIGEGPGRMEERRGEPFVGPSGKLLDGVLKAAELPRHRAHVTNAMCCRPDPDAPIAIKLAATSCCSPRLARELADVPVEAPILAYGQWGSRAVLGTKSILKSRGFIWQTEEIPPEKIRAAHNSLERMKKNAIREKKVAKRAVNIFKKQNSIWLMESHATYAGRTVIPSLHPAHILRGAEMMYPLLIIDAKRFRRVLDGNYKLEDQCKYKIASTGEQILREIARLREILPGKNDISLDIETTGKDALRTEMKCLALSDGERTVAIYPWKPSLARPLGEALRGRTLVMHNGPQFDHLVLRQYGVKIENWDDTLLAHHAFASHLSRSLSHVVSVFCDSRPWKILSGKGAGAEKGVAPWEAIDRVTSPQKKKEAIKRLLDYNAADAVLTALSWRRMQNDLEAERHTYEGTSGKLGGDKRIAVMCRNMTETGIGFDVERAASVGKHLRSRKKYLLTKMREHVGTRNFHPAKLTDIRWALFTKFRAPLLRPTKTGLASTSNETLEYLKGRGADTRAGELADLILRWRGASKSLGTYVEGGLDPHTDQRVHATFKLGPVTGRLAGPLMTLPRYSKAEGEWESKIRGFYVARPSPKPKLVAQVHDAAIIEGFGRFFYYDLSRAEARLAAYFSGDENLIAACERDIHLENAKVIFADVPEAMERLNRGNEPSPHRDPNGKVLKWKAVPSKLGGCKDERDICKNVGFCVWYEGSAERAFITLRQDGKKVTLPACEEFVRRFHVQYHRYYCYVGENVEFVRRNGFFRTVLSGRIRWLGWKAKETEISNFPIQSGIADLQNDRLPRIEDGLVRCKGPEDVKKLIKDTWDEPILIPHNGRSFIMPIDQKDGVNWGEAFG